MRIYYEGIESATVTTSATPAPGYPVTNLQDRSPYTLFTAEYSPGGSNIVIDLGAARACDFIALINYTAESGTEMDIAWSADNVSYTDVETDIDVAGSGSQFVRPFASASKRYWRLIFKDGDTAYPKDVSIGTILIGTIFVPASNPNINETYSVNNAVETLEAQGGQRYGTLINTLQRKRWEYQFNYVSEADRTKWLAMDATIKTSDKFSLWPFMIYAHNSTFYYGRMVGNMSIQQIAYQAYQLNFTFDNDF
jgi:hypothetical protein